MNSDRTPASISLLLSSTFIPGLNRASDLLRLAYPDVTDGELLERIFISGICVTIDQFAALHSPRQFKKPVLKIIKCSDPQMWYAKMVGQTVPYRGQWPEAYKSVDQSRCINQVKFCDAVIVESEPIGEVK